MSVRGFSRVYGADVICQLPYLGESGQEQSLDSIRVLDADFVGRHAHEVPWSTRSW